MDQERKAAGLPPRSLRDAANGSPGAAADPMPHPFPIPLQRDHRYEVRIKVIAVLARRPLDGVVRFGTLVQ